MGEKAATNEVISKLVNALGDESEYVRSNACSALGGLGEKAVTNEVISKLLNIIENTSFDSFYEVRVAAENILSSSAVIVQLDPNIIAGFTLSKNAVDCFRNIVEHEVMKFSLDSKNPSWLPAAARIMLIKGVAVTFMEDKIFIYGSKESPESFGPIDDLSRRKLIDVFTDQRRKLHLCFDIK
jgi:hypothetical protein